MRGDLRTGAGRTDLHAGAERKRRVALPESLARSGAALAALEPALRLERRADGLLWASVGDVARPVWVRRCFPWSAPGRYISLRDRDDEEVALVRDLGDLDVSSRAALRAALAEAGFVFEIEAVDDVTEEIEIRTFRVRTRQGPRRFQTLRDEWPRSLPGGGLLLRDVAGDLYLVRQPNALDRASRRRLWAYTD